MGFMGIPYGIPTIVIINHPSILNLSATKTLPETNSKFTPKNQRLEDDPFPFRPIFRGEIGNIAVSSRGGKRPILFYTCEN